MPYKDIDTELTPQEETQINEHLDAILEILAPPRSVNLTNEERGAISKIGSDPKQFTSKSLEYANQREDLRVPYLELPAHEKDFRYHRQLRTILGRVAQLEETIDDTQMAAGAEAFDYARAFYDVVKEAKERNVPGAEAIYMDLKERFEGQGPQGGTPDESMEESPAEEEPPVEPAP